MQRQKLESAAIQAAAEWSPGNPNMTKVMDAEGTAIPHVEAK